MSTLPSTAPEPAPAEPAARPGRWPYVLVVLAAPFLLFGLAGLFGRLAAAVALTIAAIAIAARTGEAIGAAGAQRAAARLDDLHRRGAR